jgi:hypothetical protein
MNRYPTTQEPNPLKRRSDGTRAWLISQPEASPYSADLNVRIQPQPGLRLTSARETEFPV